MGYLTGFQGEDINFRNLGPAKYRGPPTKRAFCFTFLADITFLVFSNKEARNGIQPLSFISSPLQSSLL